MSVPEIASLVAGRWHPGDDVVADRNPARPEEVVASVRRGDAALADAAIVAAHEAQRAWRDMPAPERGEVLRQAGDLLDARAGAIGRDLAREEGKSLAEGVGETRRAAAILRYYGAQTLEPDGETYPSHSPHTVLFARREPVGVVSVITPWNFPIAIPAWKIAPALAFGNTLVWKPAEIVPLTAVHFANALIDAGLPDGVLNLILARASDVGEQLVDHQAVTAISFTGSNSVGRAIQTRAVAGGKKVQLELGGKNPAIVLADADLELAALQIARGAFLSAGQKCTATSRVIVEAPVFDELAERLATIAADWRVGDPLDPSTVVGPLASEAQLQTVCGYLDMAREEHADVLAGGDRPEGADGGYYVRPTVLAGLAPESRVVREEIFGPVAALLPATTFDAAIEMANDTPFGLTASLFTRDLHKAIRFAREIRTGVVKINQESAGLEYHVPFGGMKESSSGSREQGKAAKEFFTEWKTVYLDAPA